MTHWPAFPAWFAHLLLQVVLFLGAIRNWRRLANDREVSLNRSDVKGFFGFLSWLKYGRRVHGPISTGWRSFYDLEEREVYRQWKPGKMTVLVTVFLVSPFLVLGGKPILVGWMGLVGLSVLVVTVGFSASSLKREIERGTSVFLLTSPVSPADMVLGKWVFFMRQGFGVCLIGCLSLVVSCMMNLFGRGMFIEIIPPNSYIMLFAVYGVLLCFVPLLSILRLADNARLYPKSMPYLILVGFFCCAPLGLIVFSMMVGITLIGVSDKAVQRTPRVKLPTMLLGWICFGGCFCNVIALMPFVGAGSSYGMVAYYGMAAFDLCILPLSTAYFLWILFFEKNDRWWRERLLPEENIHSPV